jgi:hypothetical protein
MTRHHLPPPQSEIGPRLGARESSLSVKLLSWLDSVFKDIRFAVRMLRKHIVVTGAAIASLTLALGCSRKPTNLTRSERCVNTNASRVNEFVRIVYESLRSEV